MKLEKMSWVAGIVVAIASILGLVIAIMAWLVAPKDFFAFCKGLAWPVWTLLLLLFIMVILSVAAFTVLSWRNKDQIRIESKNPRQQQEAKPILQPVVLPPDPRSYTSDEIWGVNWSWRWFGHQFGNLVGPFCPNPHCLCRLDQEICRDPNMYYRHKSMTMPISLVCPHCGFKRDYEFDLAQLMDKTLVEIERRINTGEYKSRLKS